jgi:hypothetical protein
MVLTLQMQLDDYLEALKAFENGNIYKAKKYELQKYLCAIAQNATGDDAIQSRDIVQSLTINHLLLQQHINELERKGRVTQRIVIALTIATLIFGLPQLWYAYKADKRVADVKVTQNCNFKPSSATSYPSSQCNYFETIG